VTSERERQTLDLLLTTIITPWQILWGKLVAGLRVSSVLTTFLLWPLLLACLMVSSYWTNLPAVGCYIGIVLLTCLTTAVVALFCSVVFRKTSISLMTTYLIIIVLFCVPLAVRNFAEVFFPGEPATRIVAQTGWTSPFAATFAVPLDVEIRGDSSAAPSASDFPLVWGFGAFSVLVNVGLLVTMIWLFNTRWRVSG
jgi:ABC-type transport system involved in multi-copper enzyme maturation permease subunit